MSEKFRLYVAFVNGIPIWIGTLNSISKFCNVRLREVKKLVPQKWQHGGRPARPVALYFVKIYNRADGSFLSGLVTFYPKERGS